MNVQEAIRHHSDFLAGVGIPSPRLEAGLLLASVLRLPRLQLHLNLNRQLNDSELSALKILVTRRARREPLQYVLGTTSFCGIDLAVNSNVLIPRPETELLAEEAWKFLNELQASARTRAVTALDLCTGSGCLAIALALRVPQSRICATDLSAAALEVAGQNARRHGLRDRIEFREGDLFGALPAVVPFDLIVSNPPYIPSARIASLAPEVRDHEPNSALDGGADGLVFYREIAAKAGVYLAGHGRLLLELDEETSAAAIDVFKGQNWAIDAVRKDYQQHPRILIAHLPSKCQ